MSLVLIARALGAGVEVAALTSYAKWAALLTSKESLSESFADENIEIAAFELLAIQELVDLGETMIEVRVLASDGRQQLTVYFYAKPSGADQVTWVKSATLVYDSDPCQRGGGSLSRVSSLSSIGCFYYDILWQYDRTGNRTRQKGTTNGPWINYTYEPGRHRIDAITDQNAVLRDRSTDANGNTLSLFPVNESTQ